MYKQFFGCPATLAIRCGIEASFSLLDSSILEISIFVFIEVLGVLLLLSFSGSCVVSLLDFFFLLLGCSDNYIDTLLDFLFFWCIFLSFAAFFIVYIGFDLCGPTLVGFWLVVQLSSMNPYYRADRYPKELSKDVVTRKVNAKTVIVARTLGYVIIT